METLSQVTRILLHGEAVAIGMVAEVNRCPAKPAYLPVCLPEISLAVDLTSCYEVYQFSWTLHFFLPPFRVFMRTGQPSSGHAAHHLCAFQQV